VKIVVIADDLSGAAEVAGIASRYGLNSEVHVGNLSNSHADVLVVDADSRSQLDRVAYSKISDLGRQACLFHADLIYKKVDSMLRGPVLAELIALQEVAGIEHCILACGNPRKRRTVIAGQLEIDGELPQNTEFALDPEHPRFTACVLELLRGGTTSQVFEHSCRDYPTLSVIEPGESFSSDIAVANVSSESDLNHHARYWQAHRSNTLAAGGGEFFEAILRSELDLSNADKKAKDCVPPPISFPCLPQKSMLVSGTRFSRAEGWDVVMLKPDRPASDGIAQMRHHLTTENRVAVRALDLASGSHQSRVEMVTTVAAGVILESDINQVWIEGGHTASSLIRKLGIQRLRALVEISDGVVVLAELGSNDRLYFVKPGSYPWPNSGCGPTFGLRGQVIQEMV
jgi:uncharacterized protein YgbK (DUF1537 family)